MKHQRGLILIELIAVILLTGIIATFTSFFLYTGFNGYLNAKNAFGGAINAQMALDRISLELRNIEYFTSAPTATSVSYISEDSELQGSRVLKYQTTAGTGEIMIRVDGNDYPLLDHVTSFELNVAYSNLNGNALVDEVSGIRIGFNVEGVGQEFRTQIFPRNLVEKK